MIKTITCIVVMLCMTCATAAHAEFVSTFQLAGVFPGYNKLRVPGNTGTRMSFTDDLEANPTFSPRFEMGFILAERHYVGVMAALLTMSARGTLGRDTSFDNVFFANGTRVKGLYRYDSYRLTYRYYFFINESFRIGAGVTGKLRDAELTLESDTGTLIQRGCYTNTGLLPMVNYSIEWMPSRMFTLYTYGDIMITPDRRTEDVFAGVQYHLDNPVSLMAGYRLLETGTDLKRAFTFAMFHYLVIGMQIRI